MRFTQGLLKIELDLLLADLAFKRCNSTLGAGQLICEHPSGNRPLA
jgi:hypothetical protein